jgi:hypothetical protein
MSFSHASLLSTPCYDYYHNSPDSRDMSEFPFNSYCCYTDATPTTIALFVPGLGWCQCLLSSFVSDIWTIANVEMLGLILGFAFAVFLSPSQPSVHMFIDSQNAEAWSRGSVRTTNVSFASVRRPRYLRRALYGPHVPLSQVRIPHGRQAQAQNHQRRRCHSFGFECAFLVWLYSIRGM